jgi:hypothetical protein
VRKFVTCSFHISFSREQHPEHAACVGGHANSHKQNGRDLMGALGVAGRIILKLMVEKQFVKFKLYLAYPIQGPMIGF